MKINKALRDAHATAKEKYERLAEEIRVTLRAAAEERGWFFSLRVKCLESFALKIETGRVPDINAMEDFLGCTVVVPNALVLPEAEELVRGMYNPTERATAQRFRNKESRIKLCVRRCPPLREARFQ